MTTLRELASRPLRTFLTVAGIAIGILALTVVGSLAERLQTIVARSTSLNSDVVFATIQRSVMLAPDAKVRVARAFAQLHAIDGVRAAVPEIIVPYETDNAGRFGPPSLVLGFPAEARALERSLLSVARGREPESGERRVAVIGPDFGAAQRVELGDVIALQGNSFVVVGVLDKTFTIFDAAVVVPFTDGQDLLRQLLPPTLDRLPDDPVSAFLVAAKPGSDVSLLARRIALIDGLAARDPREIAAAVRSAFSSPAIWPRCCMLAMPACRSSCHWPMSRPVTACAAGVPRPSSVISTPSGQWTPCCW